MPQNETKHKHIARLPPPSHPESNVYLNRPPHGPVDTAAPCR